MSQLFDRLALVTGTSSGIGAAVARLLTERGWRVLGISRRSATIESPLYAHFQADLCESAGLALRLDTVLGATASNPGVKRLALVNNAADPGLLGPVDGLKPDDLLRVYAVNTATPVALMGWFIGHSRPGQALRIVNISTGAATAAVPGLGAYGSSKAALRMAGMVLASELDGRAAEGAGGDRDISILSYEPGIVDTGMQTSVRGSSKAIVPVVEMFMRFKTEGRLVPPSVPAAEIVGYVEADGHSRFLERRLGSPAEGKR